MRLFVAVWPPPAIVAALAALPRPARPGVRWTAPEQWHVTLRFLGEVADPEPVVAALEGIEARACEAVLGPAVRALGREVAVVPVAGLDEVAAAVVGATAHLGKPAPDRPFLGHLTVARARRGGDVRAVTGAEVTGSWTVGEVALVRSHLSSSGARYEDVAVVPLDPPEGP